MLFLVFLALMLATLVGLSTLLRVDFVRVGSLVEGTHEVILASIDVVLLILLLSSVFLAHTLEVLLDLLLYVDFVVAITSSGHFSLGGSWLFEFVILLASLSLTVFLIGSSIVRVLVLGTRSLSHLFGHVGLMRHELCGEVSLLKVIVVVTSPIFVFLSH